MSPRYLDTHSLISRISKSLILVAVLPGLCAAQEETQSQEKTQTQETENAIQQETKSTNKSKQEQELLTWQLLSPEDSGFKIQFPGEAKHVQRTEKPRPDMEITVNMYTRSIANGRIAFLVGYHDVPSMPESDEKRKEILDGGIKGVMVNVIGRLTEHEAVEVEGNPARVFTYRGARRGREIRGQSQLVLVGQRVYQLSIIHLSTQEFDQTIADKFFTSFSLSQDEE